MCFIAFHSAKIVADLCDTSLAQEPKFMEWHGILCKHSNLEPPYLRTMETTVPYRNIFKTNFSATTTVCLLLYSFKLTPTMLFSITFLWSKAPNSKGTADHTLHSCCHSLKRFCLISVIFKIEHYLPRMAACWTVKTNSFFPLASSLLRLSPSTIYF